MITKIKSLPKYINFVYNGLRKTSPVQLTLFVTSRCNIRCKMCFYWEPVENKSTHEITVEEVEKISKSMPNLFWLLIGGGEVFVRKDLPEIIKMFYINNNVRHVSIPTNATYPDKIIDCIEKILTECPGIFLNLNLSLNGIGKTHDSLCQKEGVFEDFLETYKKVSILKKKYKNLGLGLNVTHSKFSEKHLDEIIDYTSNNLKEIDNISMGLVRGSPKDDTALSVNIEKYKDSIQKIESLVVQRKLPGFKTLFGKIAFVKDMIMRRVIANTVKSGYQIPCLAGKTSLVVDERTNVYPCELLGSVGNLRNENYDMMKILNSKKLKDSVSKIQCSNCFCTHECTYSTNILFNKSLLITIFKTYLVFLTKSFLRAEHIFRSFDDLNYNKKIEKIHYSGQKGNLYDGRTFGTLQEQEKNNKPTVPF